MVVELKQTPKLQTQLVITPALKQAIELLQVSRLDLITLVKKELEENPVLEEVTPEESIPEEGGEKEEKFPAQGAEIGWEEYWDSHYREESMARRLRDPNYSLPPDNYSRPESLSEHLLWQLKLSPLDSSGFRLGSYIIGLLDDDGYLRVPEEEIAQVAGATVRRVEEVIRIIQGFDPPGIASRSLEECLLIQIRNRRIKDPLAELIVRRYLPELERGEYGKIARESGVGLEAVRRAVRFLAELEPKPGQGFTPAEPIYLVPDVYIFKLDDHSGYFVLLNEDGMPKLKISNLYREIISSRKLAPGEREYFQERMRKALWFIRAIHQRQRTLYRVAKAIAEFQQDFFDRGSGYLRPLALRDIAERVGVHESTISRTVANKYAHTPQGTFEFKFFFNRGIAGERGGLVASDNVRKQLQALIQAEDHRRSWTDQELADLLRREGVRISRRTVTKYRKMMRIPSAQERRQLYSLRDEVQGGRHQGEAK